MWRDCADISPSQFLRSRRKLWMMRTAAKAETTYVDPSALLKLYIHQPESTRVSRWRGQVKGPLLVTHHGRVEIINGICLAAFREYVSPEAMADALASFEEDFAEGRYLQADLLWRAALQRAANLSRKYTPEFGCRSLDVLHVASALELGLKNFFTFDRRQQRLAEAVGLKSVVFRKS
jgi:predicted nucleic acid-binding protein